MSRKRTVFTKEFIRAMLQVPGSAMPYYEFCNSYKEALIGLCNGIAIENLPATAVG
jgi:hypothetical protein